MNNKSTGFLGYIAACIATIGTTVATATWQSVQTTGQELARLQEQAKSLTTLLNDKYTTQADKINSLDERISRLEQRLQEPKH